tara:strand:- start:111 stop:551 length:441 start_codon:yes stop_codon:yes gene_type:complete
MYENDLNLISEKQVINHVSKSWNVVSYKLPISYKLDYAMYRDEELLGFAEVKCRTHKFGTFPTYMISLAKVLKSRDLWLCTRRPTILIVSWIGKVAYLDFSSPHKIKQGGRSDRNDWQDQEPMCHYDLKEFKGIGKKNEDETSKWT